MSRYRRIRPDRTTITRDQATSQELGCRERIRRISRIRLNNWDRPIAAA
jgi:hypothetical protein